MHDIGRTQQEYAGEFQEFQPETHEYGQGETFGETVGEAFEAGFQEGGFETGNFETFESLESPLNEAQEMELASELLEVTNEEELDRFLGKLVRSVGRGVGKLVRSPIGRALGGVLKGVAKTALPIAGKALGTFVGGPIGGMIGGKLASAAGSAFGLELEGMSAEDAEFEVARRYVRFASAAVNNAASAPPSGSPSATAQSAATAAAQRFAPGLIRGGTIAARRTAVDTGAGIPVSPGAQRRGVWVRRGRRILLLGV